MEKQKYQKEEQTLKQLHLLKRGRVINYPYYPLSDTFIISDGYSFLFTLELAIEETYLVIQPFKGEDMMPSYNLTLVGLPRRLMSCLHIMDFKTRIKDNGRFVFDCIDFIIGFSEGFMIRANHNGKDFNIMNKFNKKPNVKEGLMMRMSSLFFSNQQWYQRVVRKPVLSFKKHPQSNLKYKYSYQIGNMLFFLTSLQQEIQQNALKAFTEIEWESLNQVSFNKHPQYKGASIKQRNLKAFINSNIMIIQFEEYIPPSYIYTPSGLFIANNHENKIILFSMDTMKRIMVYRVDWEIKKMKLYQTLSNRQILIVMPYDNYLYLIDLNSNTAICLKGHRSFITNCTITNQGLLISAGCDHRIGLKNIQNIRDWRNIPKFEIKAESLNKMSEKRKKIELEDPHTQYYIIESDSLAKEKFSENYFFGEFDNNFRNNNFDYGFGNFVELGQYIYAFLTYDFHVKIYSIKG